MTSGRCPGLDVLQQKSELDTTRVQARLLLNQRAQFEHAIAALIGVPAPQFAIAPKVIDTAVPVIPLGLPSDLLQRRPDIASAERAMAAANAQIGVAKAAFFPSLSLTPGIGWESTQFASLLSAPTLMWTLGAAVGQVDLRWRPACRQRRFRERGLSGGRGELSPDGAQCVPAGAGRRDRLVGARRRVEGVAGGRDRRAAFAVARQRSLFGRPGRVPRCDHRPAVAAHERASGCADSWAAMTMSVSLVKALGGGWDVATDMNAKANAKANANNAPDKTLAANPPN